MTNTALSAKSTYIENLAKEKKVSKKVQLF